MYSKLPHEAKAFKEDHSEIEKLRLETHPDEWSEELFDGQEKDNYSISCAGS